MNKIKEAFLSYWQQIQDAAPEIIIAVVLFLFFWFVGKSVGSIFSKYLGKDRQSMRKASYIQRICRWVFNVLGLLIALHTVGLTEIATSFLAAGGVMAVVLGFAFREIGENILAGIFMSFSRSFDEGDTIESNGIHGIVKQISVREVHIRTGEGCDIFVPSAMIFKNPLLNYTRDGLRRLKFQVGLDYGDDLHAAKEILLAELKKDEGILTEPAPEVQVGDLQANFAVLEMLFWINTFRSKELPSQVRSRLMNNCVEVLKTNNFTISSNVTTAIAHSDLNVNLRQDSGSESPGVS